LVAGYGVDGVCHGGAVGRLQVGVVGVVELGCGEGVHGWWWGEEVDEDYVGLFYGYGVGHAFVFKGEAGGSDGDVEVLGHLAPCFVDGERVRFLVGDDEGEDFGD